VVEAGLGRCDFSPESIFCLLIQLFEDLYANVFILFGVAGLPSHTVATITEKLDQAVVLDHLI
jgi:hypothetical protein